MHQWATFIVINGALPPTLHSSSFYTSMVKWGIFARFRLLTQQLKTTEKQLELESFSYEFFSVLKGIYCRRNMEKVVLCLIPF